MYFRLCNELKRASKLSLLAPYGLIFSYFRNSFCGGLTRYGVEVLGDELLLLWLIPKYHRRPEVIALNRTGYVTGEIESTTKHEVR